MFTSFDELNSHCDGYRPGKLRLDHYVALIAEDHLAKYVLAKCELWGELPVTVSWFANGHKVRLYEAYSPVKPSVLDNSVIKLQVLAGSGESIFVPGFIQRFEAFPQYEDLSLLAYCPKALPPEFWNRLHKYVQAVKESKN
jgi:hypothetical protein